MSEKEIQWNFNLFSFPTFSSFTLFFLYDRFPYPVALLLLSVYNL